MKLNFRFKSVFLILIFHLSPLRAETIFEVSPLSNGGDDGPNIQAKIDQAVLVGNAAVYLKAGIYNLKSIYTEPQTGAQGHLVFRGGNNVRISGAADDVVLKFWNTNKSGLIVHKTRNFNMQNIFMDYQYSPYGQGTVVNVDNENKIVWVQNDNNYPNWDNSHFDRLNPDGSANRTIFLTQTQRGQTPPKCDLVPTAAPDNQPSLNSWGFMNGLNWFRYKEMTTGNCSAGLKQGDRVALIPAYWNAYALHLSQTQGAIIQNIQIYRSPGPTIFVDHTRTGDGLYDGTRFDGIKITYSPFAKDDDRQLSSNADGIHIIGSRGPVSVENSEFYGLADDAINAHVRSAYVFDVYMSGSTPILRYRPTGGFAQFEMGDLIQIFNPKLKSVRCSANTISNPYQMPGDSAAFYVNLSSSALNCTPAVKYSEELKNAESADWVSNVSEAGGSGNLKINNNKFYGLRARAVVNRWKDSIITNNVIGTYLFGKPSWFGIYQGYCPGDLAYAEGMYIVPGLDNQVIMNNTGIHENKVSGCIQ